MAPFLYSRLRRKGPSLLLAASLLLFILLRLRHFGHLLLWDEAQFVLYARSFVEGARDPQWFYWSRFFHLHPPAYLYVCSAFYRLRGGDSPGAYMTVSLLFGLGNLLVLYRLSSHLFGRRVAAWSALFLSVFPALTFFDVWIKQDAAAAFFSTLSIYLFARKRYGPAGAALGLGMLCKETAVFALLTVGVWAMARRNRDALRGAAVCGLIAAVLCSWWYLFVSDYVGHFADFFLGRGTEAGIWRQPWHYYLSGLPTDLGWAATCLAAWGCLVCLRRAGRGDGDSLLPLCWFLPTYAFLSFSAGKPYWMVTTALPALALLAGTGAEALARWAFERAVGSRGTALALILAILLAAGPALGGLAMGEADYNGRRYDAYWEQAVASRDDALFLAGSMLPGERVAVIFNSRDIWDPTLMYYFGRPGLVPAESAFLGDPGEMARRVEEMGIGWIYVGRDSAYERELRSFLPEIRRLLPVTAEYRNGWRVILRLGEGSEQGEPPGGTGGVPD